MRYSKLCAPDQNEHL